MFSANCTAAAPMPSIFTFTAADTLLIDRVTAYIKRYMSHYDASHDFSHIERVLGLARYLASVSPSPSYDGLLVTLSALLHDVGDRKYLQPGDDPATMVESVLLGFGAEPELARKVQRVCAAVSYSSETASAESRARIAALVAEVPELGPVQDADRLDAIGAVGIGRTFTYGGAVGEREGAGGKKRGIEQTVEHFTEKLERLEGLMKTEEGRRLARERTRRLIVFREWWEEEVRVAEGR